MGTGYVRLQVCGLLACQHVQHDGVGDQFCVLRISFQCSSQGGFGFGYATQVKFCDGLADDGQRGGCARGGGEFLVDVEGGLVFLTTLRNTK